MSETTYNRHNFPGVVQLKEHYLDPYTGRYQIAIAGQVSVLQDVELLGFKTHSSDSNWSARIEGPSGESVTVPGCQIRAITCVTEVSRLDSNSSAFVR